MKFHDIKIRTNTLGSEAISDMLLINGITSFSVSDPNDFAEIVEERSVPFDYYEDDLLPDDRSVAYVDVYIAYTEQGESQMQAVADGIAALKAENLPFGSLEYTVYETDDKDWENNWKQFFHPINIGNSFVIKPSWEDCTPDGRKVLEIDPESSFGTGRHETTRLCLELLEKTDCNDADVLDMGCGSGILGIGAYLLGAKSITAVDIDENAVLITRKNAAVNGIPDGILTAYTGNVLDDSTLESTVRNKKYGVVCANIVADVLVMMMPLFRDVMAQGGEIILSGIIAPRKQKVLDALKDGFDVIEVREENDWVAILAKVR